MSEAPLIIGVAGGSGSGKTTVVSKIVKSIGKDDVLLVEHDSYYRDLNHLPLEERKKQNFDHPSSLETELMIRHLDALKEGYKIEIPVYDFVAISALMNHSRHHQKNNFDRRHSHLQ